MVMIKKKNIVFEYDEPTHYIDKENSILKDKDIKRQQNIINKLKCEFWRYNEYLNLFLFLCGPGRTRTDIHTR